MFIFINQVISIGQPDENHGEVKGFSLIYSGNFLVEAELSEMGRLRVNMVNSKWMKYICIEITIKGIHPMGLQWHLRRGHTFNTPEAVLVRSDEGLGISIGNMFNSINETGGMSRMLHRLYLDRLIPKNWFIIYSQNIQTSIYYIYA